MSLQSALHLPGVLLPASGFFYVCEQKCDSACWRAGHYYLDVLLASLNETL